MRLRCVVGLFVCLGLMPALAAAQDQNRRPSFKSKAELVEVPVIVTRGGQPVRGLTAADFALSHDGRKESVALFEEIEASPVRMERVTLPERTVQNFASGDSHQDVVILLLDFLNASWASAARISSFVKDVVNQLAEARTPATLLLLTTDGLVQVHAFTGNPENLSRVVEQWSSHGRQAWQNPGNIDTTWSNPLTDVDPAHAAAALGLYARALDQGERYKLDYLLDQSKTTLRAFEQVAESFRGIPGRKKLIWMSTGFPQVSGTAGARLDADERSTQAEINQGILQAWKALGDANIAVYTVDSTGVENPTWEGFGFKVDNAWVPVSGPVDGANNRRIVWSSNTPSLLELSQNTAGANCTLPPTDCVRKIQADANHYYVLGFYLHGDNKPGWHQLKVSVKQAGVSVRARQGFAVVSDAAPSSRTSPARVAIAAKGSGSEAPVAQTDSSAQHAAILAALASPLDYTAIPLRLHWSASSQGNDRQVDLMLSAPPGAITVDESGPRIDVDTLAFARLIGQTEGQTFPKSLSGKMTPTTQQDLAHSGFNYSRQITLAPGRYELRILLRDNLSGKIGTVSTTLDLKQ